MPFEQNSSSVPQENAPQPPPSNLLARQRFNRYLGQMQRAWQNVDPRLMQTYYQQWLQRPGQRRQQSPTPLPTRPTGRSTLRPATNRPLAPATEQRRPTPRPPISETSNTTNPTFRMPERMDQLPLSLQVKRLWESLGYERQNYVERWIQPRFGSLLDTLTDERSFQTMMRIFDTEIIPRLRDQNMLRGWVRPQ